MAKIKVTKVSGQRKTRTKRNGKTKGTKTQKSK